MTSTDFQDLCCYPTPYSQLDTWRLIRLGDSLLPGPPHSLDLPFPRLLLLGKSPTSYACPYPASNLDIPKLPALGPAQYLQLRLVDLLSDSSH
jgi:hypothetical protein